MPQKDSATWSFSAVGCEAMDCVLKGWVGPSLWEPTGCPSLSGEPWVADPCFSSCNQTGLMAWPWNKSASKFQILSWESHKSTIYSLFFMGSTILNLGLKQRAQWFHVPKEQLVNQSILFELLTPIFGHKKGRFYLISFFLVYSLCFLNLTVSFSWIH